MTRVKKPKRTGSILLSRHRNAGTKDSVLPVPHVHPVTTSALSSKTGRTVIRKHHTLHKRLSQALKKNDVDTATAIQAEIEANGGLEKYQQASVCGQSSQRGGDSSKIFMEWIGETRRSRLKSDNADNKTTRHATGQKLRLLEVGALSPDNACSKSPMFDVKRIDLNSRHPSIDTQDFMERPLPRDDSERFDIISLSLVLNYVPLPAARGEMLQRTTKFLRDISLDQKDSPIADLFPSLFLVLPAPCITNSRYLDEDLLVEIMGSLGYTLMRSKLSAKLSYQLWRLTRKEITRDLGLEKKKEVNPGKTRNNFAILLGSPCT